MGIDFMIWRRRVRTTSATFVALLMAATAMAQQGQRQLTF